MSKSSMQCKYVFKRGAKEGESCCKPSRGDFCKDHNEHKKNYNQKYYNKKNNKNTKDNHKLRIRNLKKMSINNLPSLTMINLRIKGIEGKFGKAYRKFLGAGLVADYEKYEPKLQQRISSRSEGEVHDYKKYNKIPENIYIEFSGSEEKAKKKLNQYLEECNNLRRRFKNMKEVRDTIEARHNKTD